MTRLTATWWDAASVGTSRRDELIGHSQLTRDANIRALRRKALSRNRLSAGFLHLSFLVSPIARRVRDFASRFRVRFADWRRSIDFGIAKFDDLRLRLHLVSYLVRAINVQ